MAIRYEFRDDGVVAIKNLKRANPQRIGEELAKITDAHDGRLTPDDVVEAAKNPRSALHKHFEWNDQAAAQAFRLDQAREIIRTIRIVEDESSGELTRAFLSVVDKGGAAYRRVQDVRTSGDLQAAVLQQADRDLEAWQKRYRSIAEICEEVAEARRKIARKLEEAAQRPQ